MSPTAVITGASRGVGRAVALELAARGMTPVLLSRPSEAQTETERLLTGLGAQYVTIPCDLGNRTSVDNAAAQVLAQVGAPEVLVHSGGIIERGAVDALADDSWDRQLEVNLSAPFRLTRALLPAQLAAGRGRILFISSISALTGSPHQAGYHASKAGLLGLMRCLAEELTDTGLSTMALLPGAIDTDMLKGSGYSPRMTALAVAQTLAFYAAATSSAHNGAVVEMFGT